MKKTTIRPLLSNNNSVVKRNFSSLETILAGKAAKFTLSILPTDVLISLIVGGGVVILSYMASTGQSDSPVVDTATFRDMLHEINLQRGNIMHHFREAVAMANTNFHILERGQTAFITAHPALADAYRNAQTALAAAANLMGQEVENAAHNFNLAIGHLDTAAAQLEQIIQHLDDNFEPSSDTDSEKIAEAVDEVDARRKNSSKK